MSYILINQVTYASENKLIFDKLSLALHAKKTGLIGRNGSGKSTLLKLIVGTLLPQAGSIEVTGSLAYCPQALPETANKSVADLLDVQQKLTALEHIQHGSVDAHDYQMLNDDWLVAERLQQQLSEFGLSHLHLNWPLQQLSGGEIMRLLLAKVFLTHADFIILDEPTNNLDRQARQLLYSAIQKWKKGMLIVSHDRTLLNQLEQIIELDVHGVHVYGGDYQHYEQQQKIMHEALEREVNHAKSNLVKVDQSIQSAREKHEQRQAAGNRLRRSGSQSKLILDAMKERSMQSAGKMSTKHENMLENAQDKLQQAKEKIIYDRQIAISIPLTHVPQGKVLLAIEDLCFSFASTNIFTNFNLNMTGPERLALVGKNGSGKTTLIKLILGMLLPNQGSIYLGTKQICYLDQQADTLNPELSLLDNFLQINPTATILDAYSALAKFLFRNTTALQLVKYLSGGEKLRAALACALMSKQPPQLLILDEPTNHLDLESITSIESALKCYQGAMIVISHDETFLQNIVINKTLSLMS